MVPPADVLARLIACRADVAFGVYRFRQIDSINVQERYPAAADGTLTPMPGASLSNRPHLLRRAVRDGRIACSGSGLGCVLIRRPVLAQVGFRHPMRPPLHCDVPWTRDVYQAGFSMVADFSATCGHIDTEGQVLWPSLS
jgi:hypothetical protein